MLKVNKIYNIDCREGLKLLDDESIDCCITSPPYWSLRDYRIEPSVWDGDPNCEHEWDNERIKLLNLQAGNPEFQRNWRNKNPDKIKGYTDCGCNAGFDSGIVLDPFAGTGTTLYTAWNLGRNFIGFEISKDYCKITEKKLKLTKNKRIMEFI